jgi:hypothetical protein
MAPPGRPIKSMDRRRPCSLVWRRPSIQGGPPDYGGRRHVDRRRQDRPPAPFCRRPGRIPRDLSTAALRRSRDRRRIRPGQSGTELQVGDCARPAFPAPAGGPGEAGLAGPRRHLRRCRRPTPGLAHLRPSRRRRADPRRRPNLRSGRLRSRLLHPGSGHRGPLQGQRSLRP